MLVLGVQQSDSVIHTYISIFQILFLYLLLQNIEYSSSCYTVGPCWLSTYSAFERIILHSFLNCYYGYHRASQVLSGKESACQCRRHRRCGFDPWIGKILWRRKLHSTAVFLPKTSHGQRSSAGHSPRGPKESDFTEHACSSRDGYHNINM